MDNTIASRRENKVKPTKDTAVDKEAININKPNLAKAASTEQDKNSLSNPSLRGDLSKKNNSIQPIIQRLAEMAVGNDDITDIYNLSYLMDLAATANNNIEGTNKAKSNASKSNFPNICNWDLDINIK
jgi:hypothetical protein